MINEKQALAVLSFLEQYADFLTAMAGDEKDKLSALMSDNLELIEHSILTAQANAKKLENLEKKRTAVQEDNNCAGYTLSQLCEAVPPDLHAQMENVCARVRQMVSDIKWNNDKSMGTARLNILQVNPDAVLTTVKKDSHADNPYARAQSREHENDSSSILTTKV